MQYVEDGRRTRHEVVPGVRQGLRHDRVDRATENNRQCLASTSGQYSPASTAAAMRSANGRHCAAEPGWSPMPVLLAGLSASTIMRTCVGFSAVWLIIDST